MSKPPSVLQRIRNADTRRKMIALLGNWPGEAGGLPAQRARLRAIDDFIFDLAGRDAQACRDASAGLRQHVQKGLARERQVAKLAAQAALPPRPATVGELKRMLAAYSDNQLVHLLPQELAAQAARALAMTPPIRRAKPASVVIRPFSAFGTKTAADLGL